MFKTQTSPAIYWKMPCIVGQVQHICCVLFCCIEIDFLCFQSKIFRPKLGFYEQIPQIRDRKTIFTIVISNKLKLYLHDLSIALFLWVS